MKVIVAVGDWEQEIHEALRLQLPFWVYAPGEN